MNSLLGLLNGQMNFLTHFIIVDYNNIIEVYVS